MKEPEPVTKCSLCGGELEPYRPLDPGSYYTDCRWDGRCPKCDQIHVTTWTGPVQS